jgi:nicotinate phosphoribosyltransferase
MNDACSDVMYTNARHCQLIVLSHALPCTALMAGPDGGMSASRYSFMGGFDGSSNVLAGYLHNIPVKGTHAHSFVMSFTQLADLQCTTIRHALSGEQVEFLSLVLDKRARLPCTQEGNPGELAAFVSYAQAFPEGFLALVDTYDSLLSGTPNYLLVGWALHEVGYSPRGVRLDSGDLAYLSTKVRALFREADAIIGADIFTGGKIIVSNDINEDVLQSLNHSENSIDVFGKCSTSYSFSIWHEV